MADNKVVITVDVEGNAPEKTQSLRAQMKALRDEMLKFPEGSAEWGKLSAKIGEVKDKMDAMGESILTTVGPPLERLNTSFGLIGNSLMNLDFDKANVGIKGMTSAVKDLKFKDVSEGAKGFGKTMFDLGKALLFNPLFLIGGFLVAIISNFNELAEAGGLIGDVFGFIKNAIDKVIGGLVDFMDWIGLTDSKAKERAENDKKRAEEQKKQKDEELKKAQEVEKEKERLAKEAAAKEAQRIQKIRDDQKSLNDFLKTEREKRHQETLSEQERELRQLQLTYDEKKRLAHGDAALLKSLNEEYQKEIDNINNKYVNKRAQDELAIAKKTNELLKQIKLESLAEEEALAQEIQNIAQGEQATELQNLRDSYFEKIELAKKYGLDSLVLEEDLKKKEQEINDKYAVKEVELVKMTTEQKMQLAQMSLGSLSSLADALTANGLLNAKQSFKVNKALQLAQAGIGAVQAVQSVLADPTLVGPARFIAAAAAGVAGAANVAKIAAMKFNPGTNTPPPPPGTMGGGGGGGSTSAPALDLSFLNNGQTKAQPIQSYVLATNVTSAQDAQQKILDQAKLIK